MAELLLDEEVSPAEAVVRVLEDGGVDLVVGMPGGLTIPIWDALYDHPHTIRSVLVREETRAGVVAEVYGRLTGRPAVAMGQGAFLTAAAIGAIEGHVSATPMLLFGDLSDGGPYALHGPYQSGDGRYGAWDAPGLFGSVCKEVFVANSPEEAPHCAQLALKHAVSGEPGPVAVLFSARSVRGRVGPESRPRLYRRGAAPIGGTSAVETAALARAAELLAGADRPAIVAGGGVRLSGAFDELSRLATELAAPVATTANGKSALAETDPLAVGVFGNFGTPIANAVVGDADVVLVVGSKLGPTDTANEHPELLDPTRQAIIQVDVEPTNLAWTTPVEVAVAGDAKVVLSRLRDELSGRGSDRRDGRTAWLQAAVDQHGRFDAPELTSSAVPTLPQRVIGDLSATLPPEAIVCCDAGENRIFMTHYFRSVASGSFIQPAGVGAMGYAIPGALAARLAHPDRPAVAVCGDGGFAIGMNGLMTAREEELPITVVVLNNGALGWVLHGQRERTIASRFADFDHAAIAHSMGVEGIRITDPDALGPAIEGALASGQTTVVDVVTSLDESYHKVTSPLLRRR
ncbi:MAG: thiamine pyrophosphate-binding protein [Acidimicrobiia bacterium]|nr:thiamine pyrophosphate-binding protein [Acidimicrobiia bacterium]